MDIHKQIEREQREIEQQLDGHPIQLAYRAQGVSVSGWVGGHFETVGGMTYKDAGHSFGLMLRALTPTSAELRKQAAELLAKAEAMEAGK